MHHILTTIVPTGVGKQREHFKALQENGSSPLTEQRIAKLRNLNFKFYIGKGQHARIHGVFMTDKMRTSWEAKFKALEEFQQKHGHCDVPSRYPADKALAAWVVVQRRKFRGSDWDQSQGGDAKKKDANVDGDDSENGSSSTTASVAIAKDRERIILEERRKRLTDIGFNFELGVGNWDHKTGRVAPRKSHEDAWTEQFEALKRYKEQYGHVDVPVTYKDDPKLATWVSKQREMWRNKQAKTGRIMSDDRERRLKELGFSFDAYDASWTSKLEELQEYVKKYGSADVKEVHNRALAHWCRRQREAFREFLDGGGKTSGSSMSNDRIAKMEELGFDWRYEDTAEKAKMRDKKNKAKNARSKEPRRRVGRPRKNPQSVGADSTTTTAAAAAAATPADVQEDAADEAPQPPPLNVATNDNIAQFGELAEDIKMAAEQQELPSEADAAASAAAQAAIDIANAEAALAMATKRYGGSATKDGRANTKPEKWLSMYQELINYKKDHGDCKGEKNGS